MLSRFVGGASSTRRARLALSTRCLLSVLATGSSERLSSLSGELTLITFDVDGTLVRGSSGRAPPSSPPSLSSAESSSKSSLSGAERSAHARAFAHGVGTVLGRGRKVPLPAELLPPEQYHGSTDGLIALRLARAALGIPPDEAVGELPRVFASMYEYCAALSDEQMTVGIDPLPGVLDTLRSLAGNSRVVCGLVTGNVEGIARKKMRAVGVLGTGALAPAAPSQTWASEADAAFLGGFGSDYCSGELDDPSRNHLDRAEQIVIAAKRCRELLGPDASLTRVVHVGDAPSDVLAAKHCADAGRLGDGTVVGCVGVATGSYSASHLRELCGEPRAGVWEPVVLESGLADAGFVRACGVEES